MILGIFDLLKLKSDEINVRSRRCGTGVAAVAALALTTVTTEGPEAAEDPYQVVYKQVHI